MIVPRPYSTDVDTPAMRAVIDAHVAAQFEAAKAESAMEVARAVMSACLTACYDVEKAEKHRLEEEATPKTEAS